MIVKEECPACGVINGFIAMGVPWLVLAAIVLWF